MFQFWKKKRKPELAEAVAAVERSEPEAAPFEYIVNGKMRSDIGCTRPVNQDCGVLVLAHSSPRGVLAVVADGMGGHKGGEVASQIAAEAINRSYYEKNGDVQSDLNEALQQANTEIYQRSQKSEECRGMGTTCTALVLLNGKAYSSHVGDSRLYLLRNGEIYLMSEDHSAVMELVKQGAISLQEARHHADKNVITRALGSKSHVEVSYWKEPFPVRIGDRFVLCSDGLYDRMEDSEIRDAIVSKGFAEACEYLVGLARERGGYDNITVAVVGVCSPVEEEARALAQTREVEVRA